jgi:hypothetical protein
VGGFGGTEGLAGKGGKAMWIMLAELKTAWKWVTRFAELAACSVFVF